jgi:hypothetical protein
MTEVTHDEAIKNVLDVLGDEQLTAYLRKPKAKRCKRCGFHEPTQGHATDCQRREVKHVKVLFEGKAWDGQRWTETDVCGTCGEHSTNTGRTPRCRSRHYGKAS